MELAEHENIVAVKEASGTWRRSARSSDIVRRGSRPVRRRSSHAPGDGGRWRWGHFGYLERRAAARRAAGPTVCAGDLPVRGHPPSLAEWTAAAFVEPNPIPAKAALAMMGKMSNVVRLPLVPLAEKFEPTVRAALVTVGALTA